MNLIIDGNNLCHRARYAYNLSFRGKDTSVTFGAVRMLMALVKKHEPDSTLFCWDGGTPGFRKRLVPSYKSGRKRDEDPTWPVFLEQLDELMEILPHLGALQVRRKGIEADDLMAQAAVMLVGESLIISTDDDMLQCVREDVSVLRPGKVEKLYTIDNFKEQVGYPVFQFVAAKVLQGDGSDNIAGVYGIGPKTAVKLFKDSVIPQGVMRGVSPKIKQRIDKFIESGEYNAAYTVMDLSVDLAGARMALLDAVWQPYDKQVYKWCIDRGFTSIIEAGSLGVIFGSLRKPEFDIDNVRIPMIWDYDRSPV